MDARFRGCEGLGGLVTLSLDFHDGTCMHSSSKVDGLESEIGSQLDGGNSDFPTAVLVTGEATNGVSTNCKNQGKVMSSKGSRR